jgi:hypothetical protein
VDLLDTFTARDYTSQITTSITHMNVLSHGHHCRCLVAASYDGHFPSTGFPKCPRSQLPALLTTGSSLDSTLYNLDPDSTGLKDNDKTENTAYNSSPIVAFVSDAAITWRLLSHCLITDVITEPFPSYGCLCWLHNSVFQQTCHIIINNYRQKWVFPREL